MRRLHENIGGPRRDAKAISLPEGDQTEKLSFAAARVTRVRTRSPDRRSRCPHCLCRAPCRGPVIHRVLATLRRLHDTRTKSSIRFRTDYRQMEVRTISAMLGISDFLFGQNLLSKRSQSFVPPMIHFQRLSSASHIHNYLTQALFAVCFAGLFATLHAAADRPRPSYAARTGLVTVAPVCATASELPVVDIGWPDRLPMTHSFRQLRLVRKTLFANSWIHFLGLWRAGLGNSVSLMTQPPCEGSGRGQRIDTACE
jgi:hypothetical protein